MTGAFLLAFGVGATGILVLVLAGRKTRNRDPRQWVRSQPMIGAVVLAAGYTLLAIPGDALWHELFGPDLTAWSPPHLALAAASTAVILCSVGLLLEARRSWPSSTLLDLGLFVPLGLALNLLYTAGVLEWELPGEVSRLVAQRPAWAFPLVSGALTYFILALARFSIRLRMPASATAVAFYALRLAITLPLAATHNIVPDIHLWILPGALILDLVPWQRINRRRLREAAMAAGYSASFGVAALIDLARRVSRLRLDAGDQVISIIGLWMACLLLGALARTTGRLLARERAAEG